MPLTPQEVLNLVHDTLNDRVKSQDQSFTQTTAGVTGAGAGTAVDMSKNPMNHFTLMVDRTAGTTDVVEIDLEGSVDGVDFRQIGSLTVTSLAQEPVLIAGGNTPMSYMRYNVVTVGAGNTLQVHILATK
jgi:hypothetical protein